MKACTKCAEQKQLGMFNISNISKDGRVVWCKACCAEYKKKWQQENKEKIAAQSKKYYEANLEKSAARDKKHYEENKSTKLANRKKHYAENKEQTLFKSKNYYQENKEQIAVRVKKWAQNNKAAVAAITRKRHAAKLRRTPVWLSKFDEVKIKCLYQLAAMRTRESGQKWHVDHIIPLQGALVSGLHVPSNMRVIPAVENHKKNNAFVVC